MMNLVPRSLRGSAHRLGADAAVLLFGADGQGRHDAIVARAAAAVRKGHGVVFVDASREARSLAALSSAARSARSWDDLLTMDLAGGAGAVIPDPLAAASPRALEAELLAVLAASGGKVDEGAHALASFAAHGACWAASVGLLDIGCQGIIECLGLPFLVRCASHQVRDRNVPGEPAAPREIARMARAHLSLLPGYQAEKSDRQAQATVDAHLRIAAPLVRAAQALDAACGTDMGRGTLEMHDVVASARILHVRLDSSRLLAGSSEIVFAALTAQLREALPALGGGAGLAMFVDGAEAVASPSLLTFAEMASAPGASVAVGARSGASLRLAVGESCDALLASLPTRVVVGHLPDQDSLRLVEAAAAPVVPDRLLRAIAQLRTGRAIIASQGRWSRLRVRRTAGVASAMPGRLLFRAHAPECDFEAEERTLPMVQRLCDPNLPMTLAHEAQERLAGLNEAADRGDQIAAYARSLRSLAVEVVNQRPVAASARSLRSATEGVRAHEVAAAALASLFSTSPASSPSVASKDQE